MQIPADIKPADGRFGCGPARIRPAALASLAGPGAQVLGTSHRQAPVKDLVRRIREGLAELYRAPEGYEVALGNGGSTLFWDAAIYSLVEQRSAHGSNGEFSSKFAAEAARAPFLADPVIATAPVGSAAVPQPTAGVDAYAWAQNETSTGAATPVQRVAGDEGALTLIDATSAAGGIDADLAQTDAYYFAPQKNFGSDGGLWVSFLSPAAIERIGRIAATDRWIPEILSLQVALDNSRKDQTLNTPAIATLWLLAEQVDWLNTQGGMAFATARTQASAAHLYGWADAHELATPFVEQAFRSPVVGTIDFAEQVDAAALAKTLRANGIIDVEPYRKLGRNQLRIGMFTNVPTADVEALTACIDYVLERMA
ncbi:phosphoserine aminotransferase apoenzyme [Raineyella antarctica]|uniref:Phosphoserine aminotransferase n=1 Tax=Raineyella antarctica TaxID=1577474 RepID=A0A1G6GEC5_9ACTN|nr:phosphoserine aminotransferase apoenzyme [Raineyella antarctica]